MPDTLTDFLLARIDGEEYGADEWHRDDCATHGPISFSCDCNGPKRVRAECEAKRRIISECQEWIAAVSNSPRDSLEWYDRAEDCILGFEVGPQLLRTLGTVYADHPDYRAEWSPDA
jgi:hypothetical protein